MDGREVMGALIQRGYTPIQAAAIAGHVIQESGGDPTNVNQKEGAQGLLQWRLDRLDNLRNFAKERGVAPTDPNLQLDFIAREMSGPEAKSSAAFRSATDLQSASAALKPYIRFGDNSDATRLNNARFLLGQGPLAPSTSRPAAIPAVANAGAPAVSDGAQEKEPLLGALAAVPKQIASAQNTPAPLQLAAPAQIALPQPDANQAILRARQMAQAMLSMGNTGIVT